MSLVFRDVEVDGERTDVLIDGDRIAGVGSGLSGDEVVEGNGGVLLPGLHDHHLHVLAMAAWLDSVDVSADNLEALSIAPGTGWIRAVGLGNERDLPDRYALDALVADRPVRVQHRTGGLWILNSRALELIDLDESADVERDAQHVPTGRLWRYDSRLRASLAGDQANQPDVMAVGRLLASYGITSVTDATPDLDVAGLELVTTIPQHVTSLGPHGTGPRKIALRDHDLPSLDELSGQISAAHAAGRSVAVHCVTDESLVLTLAALEQVGPRLGDRIEHAAVVPPGLSGQLAELGVRVVTQPGFLLARGDDYLREIAATDHDHLYPYAGLLNAGVPTCASSDAPYGPVDPWQIIGSARDRVTRSGVTIGAAESVTTRMALDGYLSSAQDPGGTPRTIAPGRPADLVLMSEPLDRVLASPSAALVAGTWIGGTS